MNAFSCYLFTCYSLQITKQTKWNMTFPAEEASKRGSGRAGTPVWQITIKPADSI